MLLELFFERKQQHPVGSVDLGMPEDLALRPIWRVLHAVVGTGLLSGGAYLALQSESPLRYLSLFAFYLFVSYVISPKPDRTNMGLLGGLVDHPFRFSDDRNRALLGLQALLLPGRFAVTGARQLVRLFTHPSTPVATEVALPERKTTRDKRRMPSDGPKKLR